MPPSPPHHGRSRIAALVLALLGPLLLTGAGPATGAADGVRIEQARVAGAGGVELDTAIYLPETLPAPAVLVAHGFGGSLDSVAEDARALADRGFLALTWSARGFGTSTGEIALNAPEAEVADAQVLLDLLAERDDVVRDAPGDPRVGVTGGSYGGALALLLAGYDERVDAIAPVITWNDLGQALFPNAATAQAIPEDTPARGADAPDGVFKSGWAGVFFAAGASPGVGPAGGPGPAAGTDAVDPTLGTPDGAGVTGPPAAGDLPTGTDPQPTDPQPTDPGAATDPGAPSGPGTLPAGDLTCGRFTIEVCAAYTEAATTGRLSADTAELLARSSPSAVTDRITAPTLLVQGEQDTLFGLDHADANAREIAANGTPVSVSWFAGGHDGAPPGPAVRDRIGDWFDTHLRDAEAGVPAFSYDVESGVRTRGGTPTGRTVVADAYPGLAGAAPTVFEATPLEGGPQPVVTPAGGNPAAITTLPGVGGALGSLGARLSALTSELPGQSARFATPPRETPAVLTGAPRVELAVSRAPGQPAPDEAVLFGRIYEVSPDGLRRLLGSAVAPFRVPVPADGSPAEVTVTLPGVVAPIEAGNQLVVSIASTDQGYAGGTEPAVWQVDVAEPVLAVPTVPGEPVTANTVPTGPLLGIVGILAAAALAWLVARLRRDPAGTAVQTDAPPLRIADLAKTYRGGFSAVKGVSFAVDRGMVLGLLGPNGAGKTTVLRMLMGLIRPTGGEITAFGARVGPGSPVLARIGAFVEGPGFLPHLSGVENLRLYWAATGRPIAEARLDDACEIAGLGDSVHRRVGAYSQGMRQRLAIAQAMLGLPELLVLDEPTNGLDPPQIHAMREVLRRYAAGGRTVLVSSHLLAEVEQTCTHVVVMHHGRVVADGTVEGVIADGGAASFTVDATDRAADVLRALDGVREVQVDGSLVHADLNGTPRSSAVRALVDAGVDVTAAGPRRRLEDAFLQLVEGGAR